MPQQPLDPVLNGFVGAVLFASLAAWCYALARWQRGPLLRYERRRPVPWGPAASVLVAFFVLMALSTWAATSARTKESSTPNVEGIVLGLVMYATMIAGVFVVLVVTSQATARDLGVPSTWRELVGDVWIGIVACLIALLPVHIVQIGLIYLFKLQDQPSGHELVKLVSEGEPDVLVMILAGVAAVVVAPFCEEIAFRLLFQGWLEKWEDLRIGWRGSLWAENAASGTAEEIVLGSAEAHDDRLPSEPTIENEAGLAGDPPRRSIAGLPYGAVPILVSSALFGLAHFGYGPEPVPLFVLGLVLGYVYHRTHRIVPSIVAHALFNALTMVVLWRIVFYGAK